jgi:hypothetical protein
MDEREAQALERMSRTQTEKKILKKLRYAEENRPERVGFWEEVLRRKRERKAFFAFHPRPSLGEADTIVVRRGHAHALALKNGDSRFPLQLSLKFNGPGNLKDVDFRNTNQYRSLTAMGFSTEDGQTYLRGSVKLKMRYSKVDGLWRDCVPVDWVEL